MSNCPHCGKELPLTPEARFNVDPFFHAIVRSLYEHIAAARFTPTEIREAAMLAQIMYERSSAQSYVTLPKGSR